MPHCAWNKSSPEVKARYFELIRKGWSRSKASQAVGVSLSCGSNWFIDAGRVDFIETAISSRFLNQDDRIEIADGLTRKEPVKEIAARIGRSLSTVYREIARNTKPDGTYQPWFAHNQAHVRRRRPKQHRFVEDPHLCEVVAEKLAVKWSPAQISRWLRRRWPRRLAWHVCHETIYEAIYRGLIVVADRQTLRAGRTYRRRRGRGRSRDGSLKQSTNLKPIRARPAAVESRRQVGHWEGDLIIGAGLRSAIGTLVERKTRFTVLVHLPDRRTAQVVGDQLIATLEHLPSPLRRTLTWGQGNEMFHHERIEAETGVGIYFADPHSPWQRGTNENTNGLLRQYFPKGTDLSQHGPDRLAAVALELNNRPRSCLEDRTPAQLMRRWMPHPLTT